MLNGYKTYIGILIAVAPEVINAIVTGVASGQTWIVIAGGVLAILGRYLAKPVTK